MSQLLMLTTDMDVVWCDITGVGPYAPLWNPTFH